MGEPGTNSVSFDQDTSFRHRNLWNTTMKDLGYEGIDWKNDFGKIHAIDDPRDLVPTEEAKEKYGWNGTAPIESSPKLLAAIEAGNVELEKRRTEALAVSMGIIVDVTSFVDTSILSGPERELVRRLKELEPTINRIDIKLKDFRGLKYKAYLEDKRDELGLKQFNRLGMNMCSPALPTRAPKLAAFCSPVDIFPNERPTMGTYNPTELVPTDITEEEKSMLGGLASNPIFNPYTVPYTIIERDPTAPNGWKYATLSQDVRFAEDVKYLAGELEKIAEIEGLDPSLKKQLLAHANFIKGTDPFAAYAADEAWIDQRTGNLDILVGPMTGYSPMGKLSKCWLTVNVVRKREAETLEKYYIPNLQGIENYYASRLADYKARELEKDVPVRVVDTLVSAGGEEFTTLAFVHPDEGPAAEKGKLKRIIIANHLDAKYEKILSPLAEQVLVPEQMQYLSKESFVMFCAMHEIMHGIGPRSFTVMPDGQKASDAIGDQYYDAIEESRANVGSMVAMKWLHDHDVKKGDGTAVVERGDLNRVYVTYIAGLFRQMRFGSKAHGGGAWSELNFFIKEGAVVFEKMEVGGQEQTRVRVDLEKMPQSLEKLLVTIGNIQQSGDREAAEELIDKENLTSIPEEVDTEILPRVNSHDIPVDVAMTYMEK